MTPVRALLLALLLLPATTALAEGPQLVARLEAVPGGVRLALENAGRVPVLVDGLVSSTRQASRPATIVTLRVTDEAGAPVAFKGLPGTMVALQANELVLLQHGDFVGWTLSLRPPDAFAHDVRAGSYRVTAAVEVPVASFLGRHPGVKAKIESGLKGSIAARAAFGEAALESNEVVVRVD